MFCSEQLSCSWPYDLISESAIPRRQRALVARSGPRRFRGTLSDARAGSFNRHSIKRRLLTLRLSQAPTPSAIFQKWLRISEKTSALADLDKGSQLDWLFPSPRRRFH